MYPLWDAKPRVKSQVCSAVFSNNNLLCSCYLFFVLAWGKIKTLTNNITVVKNHAGVAKLLLVHAVLHEQHIGDHFKTQEYLTQNTLFGFHSRWIEVHNKCLPSWASYITTLSVLSSIHSFQQWSVLTIWKELQVCCRDSRRNSHKSMSYSAARLSSDKVTAVICNA